MRPICVPCRRFYKPAHTGIAFVEGMPEEGAKPGNAEPERWKPYKLWSGDLWKCPECKAEIIVGAGRAPLSVQHEPGFAQAIEREGAQLQINDC